MTLNPNIFIPPGSTSSYQMPIVDSRTPVAERFSNPNTIKKRIINARIQDNYRKNLVNVFKQVDTSGDNRISRQEMNHHFQQGVSISNLQTMIIHPCVSDCNLLSFRECRVLRMRISANVSLKNSSACVT